MSEAVGVTTTGPDVDDVHDVAVGRARGELAPDVVELLSTARAVVERALEGDTLVYGLTSHLGHRRDDPIEREALQAWQVSTIEGHAGGIGDPLDDADVRAMMLARIAGAARGGAGIHPDAIATLAGMLNAGVHPVVPRLGSVGAGDLMHMAAIAAVVIGRGRARVGEEVLPGGEALAR